MRALAMSLGVLSLGVVACGSLLDLVIEPLTAACPTMTQATVQNLVLVLEDLEESGMSRMDALSFAAENCVENSVRGGLPEDLAEPCEACANTVVTVVYDTF